MAGYGDDGDDMDGVTFHDRLEFWGLEVPPNKKVDVMFGDTDEELVHLTQARSAHASTLTTVRRAAAHVRRDACAATRRCAGAALVLAAPPAATAVGLPPRGAHSARQRPRDRGVRVPKSEAQR